jgi:hypothetical protein
VQTLAFESHGLRGTNVVATLPGRRPELILVGAHHDTAPDAPGAYDDGGGVGVLIEAARAFARGGVPPRTLVFVSFDGEEAWSTGRTLVAGSRAYVRALGPRVREVAAAFVVEMCGWKGGTPVLHPIAYEDPLQPGSYVIAPGWVVAAALRGARAQGSAFGVGDPLLSWLYQPGVRTVRASLYGDDRALLEAGVPALFAADSSFTAFYPWYHQPADTADKLDPAALARMGQAVVGAVEALAAAPRGPAREPHWFAAFGVVVGAPWIYVLGACSLLPRVVGALLARGLPLAVLLQAALFGVLLWRHPVAATWMFLLPNLLAGAGGARLWAVALAPLLALASLGLAASVRGMAGGLWLAPWELTVAAAALGLLWVGPPARRPAQAARARGRRLPGEPRARWRAESP